jgi:hypothetical protein
VLLDAADQLDRLAAIEREGEATCRTPDLQSAAMSDDYDKSCWCGTWNLEQQHDEPLDDIPVCSVPRWQVLLADAARCELVHEVRQAVTEVDANADAAAIAEAVVEAIAWPLDDDQDDEGGGLDA